MTWDPDIYGAFSDERLRPGVDLLGRVPNIDPPLVVDLGCGTGILTTALARRWPGAKVVGVDASDEMLQRVPAHPNIEWRRGDIASWEPTEPVGLIYSNAALHWVDDHEHLFARLASALADGGVLAIQMPANWTAPTHRIPAQVLDAGDYGSDPRARLLRNRVANHADYRRWLGADMEVETWSTTYHHVLGGPNPVLAWVRGSILAPVVAALDGVARQRFLDECARGYRAAYPPQPDGTTILPFTRLFILARRR
ncbi:MAG: methyltransferase domain-containing protein [Acidimicrobiia bacterium]